MTPSDTNSAPSARVGGGGCSAAERGDASPVLGPAFSLPFRWEVVPDPNPDCATTGALGEADTREAADAALREALAGFSAGFGFLYAVAGGGADGPARVQELARIPVAPRAPEPPAWARGA